MPRLFVNSMANFMIQGGIVSFTLQDQSVKTGNGPPRETAPEDIVDVVMREQDFGKLLQFFNQHLTRYQKQSGSGSAVPEATPFKPASAGFKIRPKTG